jgi:hypothetical protein
MKIQTVARQASKCPGCGEGISEGDSIFKLVDEGSEDWVCVRCQEEAS